MSHTTRTRTRPAHAARSGRAAVSPRIPRRVSGPVAPRDAGVLVRPRPAPEAPQRKRTGLFARVAVENVLDRVLRGRSWIWFVGLALGGIVFMQVWLLKLNTGISRAVQTTSTLERQNAGLEASIARLSAGERIRRVAGGRGMMLPAAGEVGYVTVRPEFDERKAIANMQEPTAEARERLTVSRQQQATIDPDALEAGQITTGQAAPVAGQAPAAAGQAAPATTPSTTADPAAATAPGGQTPSVPDQGVAGTAPAPATTAPDTTAMAPAPAGTTGAGG